jgi:ferredoxin--NADP+ reductase
VDGENRYACVEGPEFDGHQVDFDLLADRLRTYRTFEQAATEFRERCRVGLTRPTPAEVEAAR